ncbi:gliding motility-associated C-terminal domain-containing protein [Pseudobacter ginsenosidimutans]|uniref:gliding motility-associated C-terminal domain-containing protein n=1 Tax=Pseudobacter ginsenosidimutans TaxID=661488 RepID=UPI0011BBF048|nr:gliding motility-associated C-terminal domain-containing protein [Pseudobacter ginsenosidimutans]QEC44597.1 gliding motility-associated C-terminal domain-containing protein [Pseudobacter ginsenosidimutans]
MGLPTWLPLGTSKGYGFRFRISSDMASAQNASGSAVDGEVEDYFIDFEDFCNIKVTTVNDTSVCPGKPVQLFTSGGITYSWNKTDYLDDINSPAPVANAATTTTYIVTGANPQGCIAKDTITIDMLPVPALTTSGDINICRNTTTVLTATAPGAIKFSWQPATGLNDETISNPLANPATETEYTVTAEDMNGCTSSSKLKVMFWPLPSFSVSPLQKEICEKEIVEFKAEGADEYTWSSQDNTPLGTSPELSLQATVSQVYKVEMRSLRCGENSIIHIPVFVNPLPKTIVTKSNDLNCRVGLATLHASGGDYYRWDALPGIVDLRSPAPTVNPLVNTKYYVSAFSYKGCQTKDSVMVEVNFTNSASNYPVPSAFTPNNDGKNDCFGLKQWGNIKALDFSVFNRWGQLLFRTNDPLKCWDGRYNGQLQPAAGYTYQIKATTACGTVFRKGIVMLIR